jgi:hypothetical protein
LGPLRPTAALSADERHGTGEERSHVEVDVGRAGEEERGSVRVALRSAALIRRGGSPGR